MKTYYSVIIPGCGALNIANVDTSYSNGFSVGSTASIACDSVNGRGENMGNNTWTCGMDGWSRSEVSCESKWVSSSWSTGHDKFVVCHDL